MAWQLVTKAEAADWCGVEEDYIKDTWSDYIEKLIFAEYKYTFNVQSYIERYSGDNKSIIFLRHLPVVSITNVKYVDYVNLNNTSMNIFPQSYMSNSNYIQLTNGTTFPYGVDNIEVTYVAGVDFDDVDGRLALAELTCISYLVKFFVANRGEDSIKFSSAPALGTNQYSSRPGVIYKMKEIIRSLIPRRVRMS